MTSPDWQEHTKFSTRVWRGFGFALPTGFVLWIIYAFATAFLSGCGEPIFDRTTEPINLLFRLMFNCFLAAVSPALFCLYEGWTCWHRHPTDHYYSVIEFVATGFIPITAYLSVAIRKKWLHRDDLELKRLSTRRLAISCILLLVFMPFADHILGAPARMADSFRWLSLTGGQSNSRPTAIKARTQALLLAKSGKNREAMTLMLAAIDADSPPSENGVNEWLGWDYSILDNIDQKKALTTKEWLTLVAPAEAKLTSILNRTQNFEDLRYSSAWQAIKPLVAQHFAHGAVDEGLKWLDVAHKYERKVRGETNDDYLFASAELAQAAHKYARALELLQYKIALGESTCINDLRTPAEKSKSQWLFYNDNARDIFLYQKIVDKLPEESWHKKNLHGWLRSRELHRVAVAMIDSKEYPAAERFLLDAAKFDTTDKSCLRAWSIYQNLLGSVKFKLNKLDDADKHYQLALANDSFAVGGNPYCAEVARDLVNCATLVQKQGRLSDAERMLNRALEIDTKVLGENAPESRAIQEKLIGAYSLLHKYDLLERIYKHDVKQAENDQYYPSVRAERICKLADFYVSRGDYAKAEAQLVAAINASGKAKSYSSPVVSSLDQLGDKYLALKNYPKAQLQYQRAYLFCDDHNEMAHGNAKRFDKFARLFIATKDFGKALEAAERAVSIRRKDSAPEAEIAKSEKTFSDIKMQAALAGFDLKNYANAIDTPRVVPDSSKRRYNPNYPPELPVVKIKT